MIECFEKYKTAFLNSKGEEAIKYIDSKSVDYYKDILDKILYADKEEVMKESYINRFMIFRVRHSMQLKNLKEMDVTRLLVFAIDHGWIEKDAAIGMSVKNVKINGNMATADYYQDNKKTGIRFQFFYENEQWKYNYTSVVQFSSSLSKQQIKEFGYSDEDEFIFDMIWGESGKKVSKDIYESLIKK
ncbi:hypothetical protein LCGC14_1091560 [marine sediment metagenome]|uniref:Uncharacterized protein n=1 Tax=marine sediment metagenome TaxID=412755 RepID=A0A0F9MCA1_9ZZZZ|nr:hypothetical protein [Candidatus Aminicenantes bacterium]